MISLQVVEYVKSHGDDLAAMCKTVNPYRPLFARSSMRRVNVVIELSIIIIILRDNKFYNLIHTVTLRIFK